MAADSISSHLRVSSEALRTAREALADADWKAPKSASALGRWLAASHAASELEQEIAAWTVLSLAIRNELTAVFARTVKAKIPANVDK